jgi:predicted  nucleic acid-binding Zn-ribbon protein/transposase
MAVQLTVHSVQVNKTNKNKHQNIKRRCEMQQLSTKKKLDIVRLYLDGLSYSEIAAKVRVGKGTVANVVAELKTGLIPGVQEPAEQLELLRELSVDLHHLNTTAGQAIVGLSVYSHLNELGLEPAQVQNWAMMCKRLAGEQTEVRDFVRAAMYFEELRKSSGLTVNALEQKVRSLREEAGHLEPLTKEAKARQRQLDDLGKKVEALQTEIPQLEKRRDLLSKENAQKERQEAERTRRVHKLEERALAAEERTAVAREGLQSLAELGMSAKDLLGFVQRLAGIAHRHAIDPDALKGRLLRELEQLDAGLGLKLLVEARQRELASFDQALMKKKEEEAGLNSSVQRLRRQQAKLRAALEAEQAHFRQEMQGATSVAREFVANLRKDLTHGINEALLEVKNLRSQTFELGRELGCFQSTVEANEWLRSLVGLVKGDGSSMSAGQVRAVSLTVLRGAKGWIEQKQGEISAPSELTKQLGAAIVEFEQWKT